MLRERKRKPTHPGVILKDLYLTSLNISISRLATHIHVSRKCISQIVNGRAGITPEMAYKLAKAFNTTPQLWVNLQRNYDLWQVEHETTDWNTIEKIANWSEEGLAKV